MRPEVAPWWRQAAADLDTARLTVAADRQYDCRAQTTGQREGFLKAVVDAANDRILGTARYVAESSEMNAVIHLAMRLGMPYTLLRDEMYTHPTFMEGLNRLFTSWVT